MPPNTVSSICGSGCGGRVTSTGSAETRAAMACGVASTAGAAAVGWARPRLSAITEAAVGSVGAGVATDVVSQPARASPARPVMAAARRPPRFRYSTTARALLGDRSAKEGHAAHTVAVAEHGGLSRQTDQGPFRVEAVADPQAAGARGPVGQQHGQLAAGLGHHRADLPPEHE